MIVRRKPTRPLQILWPDHHEYREVLGSDFLCGRLDESIRAIDDAIFLLAIDNIDAPADENEAGARLAYAQPP